MKIYNPPMQFKDDSAAKDWEEGLGKNQDPYGNAVYRFASEWATRMEQALADPAKQTVEFGDIAKKCSHEADEGITGFMYGCAVSMLSAWWIRGEQLRKWHNLDTQIGDEGEKANKDGGVLNPAVINIST